MYITKTTLRVRYAETDQMGVVYYGNYAQYFEVGRTDGIRDLGYTYKQMETDGIIMPVTEMHIKYIKPAKYDDVLTIHTQIDEMPIAHKINFAQTIYNEYNDVLCKAEIILCFLLLSNMRKTVIPESLKAKLLPYYT